MSVLRHIVRSRALAALLVLLLMTGALLTPPAEVVPAVRPCVEVLCAPLAASPEHADLPAFLSGGAGLSVAVLPLRSGFEEAEERLLPGVAALAGMLLFAWAAPVPPILSSPRRSSPAGRAQRLRALLHVYRC